MLRRSWRVLLLCGVFLAALPGNWNDTSTGLDLDKLRRFPLTKLHSGSLQPGSRIAFDGISANAGGTSDRQVHLRGAGKSGKQWEAHIVGIDEVWRGDLDGNGTQDYIFFGGGPYFNGRMTPVFSLSVLLMDPDGMPFPFFTVVYKGENGAGIKHFVDLAHDGLAELIISTYDEIPSDARVGVFCSGHWVSQLYSFHDLAAKEIRGTVGGIEFPFIHDWTYRGKYGADEPNASATARPAILHEHGTGAQGNATTKIRGIRNTGVDILEIDPVSGCKTVSPRVIVYDHPRAREIAFPNLFTSDSSALANRILRASAKVELRGIDRSTGNGDCFVNLLWAH